MCRVHPSYNMEVVILGGAVRDEAELSGLLNALASDDLDALGPLYERLAPSVYRLALWRLGSEDAAGDVVQDVFVRLAERRGKLQNVRRPTAYVLSVAHHCAIDAAKRRSFERALDPLVEPALPASDRAGDAAACTKALRALPALHREVVYLKYFEDMTFAQIGLTLGISTFTAASRFRLAIKRLRRLMGATR